MPAHVQKADHSSGRQKHFSSQFLKNFLFQNYSKYLKQLLQSKKEDAEEDSVQYKFENPFDDRDEKVDYEELGLKEKVIVLNQLCEFRLEASDVAERVKNLDAASLRVEPLGVDSEGTTLWYFYGTRLYREDPSTRGEGKELDRKKRKKHKKEKKKRRKKSREDQTESSEEEEQEASWSVACLTELDWENLTAKYKESKRKEDRRLYRLLNDSFLPEIKEMFIEKEREEARKMQSLLSKRSSSRLETLKKTQEERDRQLALLVRNIETSFLIFFSLHFPICMDKLFFESFQPILLFLFGGLKQLQSMFTFLL